MAYHEENDSQREAGVMADGVSKTLDKYTELTAPTVMVSLIATALIWIVLIASPSTVAWIVNALTSSNDNNSSKGNYGILLLLALPFIFPFLAIYSIARARHPDMEDESTIRSGMMAGYNYRTRSDNRWRIWILAGMTGALNCLLLVVVYNIR
jgi:hypothetical protein